MTAAPVARFQVPCFQPPRFGGRAFQTLPVGQTMHLSMERADAALFRELLSKSSVYLEFGMGGSTLEAARAGVKRIYGVDSDHTWITRVQEAIKPIIEKSGTEVVIQYADIGPTREWGIPASETIRPEWPRYFLDIWKQIDVAPDLVLVDGRFRTACAVIALLTCPPETKIAVHDFYDKLPLRKNYHRLLELATVECKTDNLVVLKKDVSAAGFKAISVLADVWNDFG
ncbi:hypothetical protein AAII07_30070 [Microvirga sp. 0TCS3.31]